LHRDRVPDALDFELLAFLASRAWPDRSLREGAFRRRTFAALHCRFDIVSFLFAISFAAAITQALIAGLSLAFARAPGSEHLRWFAAIAGTAAAYSANNSLFSLEIADSSLLVAARANVCLAHLHVAAWIVYARAWHRAPLDRPHRWLALGLLVPAMLALVPGLYVNEYIDSTWLPMFESDYRRVSLTAFGEVSSAVLVAVLIVPFSKFLRSWRAKRRGAGMHVAAFSIFFLGSVNEFLVATGVVDGPYWADVGFMAIVAIVATEMATRATRNARELVRLSGRLGQEVERRGAALRRAEDVLLQAERLSALGRLAAGVGHEINNPLSYVLLNLEFVTAQSGLDAEVRRSLEDATEGARRIRRLTRDLRLFARADVDRSACADVEAVADSATRLILHDLRHRARLERDFANAPLVAGDPARLGQVVTNLLVNAVQAIPVGDAESNTIGLAIRTDAEGWACIEVSDTGTGMPEDVASRAFEPFFTTKGQDEGTGLGLAICHGIVTAMGGRIEVDSKEGIGTTVRVHLPPAPESAMAATASRAPGDQDRPERDREQAPAGGRVLVIDDDRLVAVALAQILDSHEVVIAKSGREGLARLEESRDWDAIICDLMMADLSGMEVDAQLRARWPELARHAVYLTGGAFTDAARAFLERSDVLALRKPVDSALLRQVVGALVLGDDPIVPDRALA
jgi:signal transduction histidine kinase